MNPIHASIAEQLAAVQVCVDGLVDAIAMPGAASADVTEQVHALAGRFGALAQGVRELVGTPHAAKRPRVDDGKGDEAGGGEAQGGGIDDHAGERGTEEPPAKRQRSIRSHWDRLPAELHAMVLARASPVTKLINGITVDVARLPRSEQRAIWLDVFDLDWRSADPSVLKPNETLGSCTDKDLWHIRSREMHGFLRSWGKPRGLQQVALRRSWFDIVEWLQMDVIVRAELDLEHLQVVLDRFEIKPHVDLIVRAAEAGRMDFVQWLRSVAPSILSTKIMDGAAAGGHLQLVQFLHSNYPDGCTTNAMNNAAANGHLDVVEFLHANRTEGCTKAALVGAAANGHLRVVEFLHANRTEGCTTKAMDDAASNGHLHVVEFLQANRTEGCTNRAMDFAASWGHLPVVEFLHTNRTEGCTTKAMDDAAANGHLRVVEFLHNNRTEGCTNRAMDCAASWGHPVVEFLHNNRTEGCTTKAMDNAAANGHLDVVEFLHASRTEGCTIKAMDDAAANGHLPVVMFLHANRTEGCTRKAMDAAAANGHLDVVQYLHRNNIMTCTVRGANSALSSGHIDLARFMIVDCGLIPSDHAISQVFSGSHVPSLRLVLERGLHRRMSVDDMVRTTRNIEMLDVVAEFVSDKQRGRMMRLLARRGDLDKMRMLHARWPQAIESVVLEDVWKGAPVQGGGKKPERDRENEEDEDNEGEGAEDDDEDGEEEEDEDEEDEEDDDDGDSTANSVVARRIDILDFVLAHKPALFNNQSVASLISHAIGNLNFRRITWIRRNFPAAFAAHPASNIEGEPAGAIIDALAKSGLGYPRQVIEEVIKCNDVAAVKWLRDNVSDKDGQVKRRAEWFLKHI
ncbi:hypothetical protein HK105_203300 [Polyrhizophydium stewartii]|uniref:Ankyrin repeat protein n=1 Tax=Polyrhizophydium stewartii TaxID=2732419 RepID=A0ABR4NCI7_9FUNG